VWLATGAAFDLESAGAGWKLATSAVAVALLVAAVVVALRGLHRPPLGASRWWIAAAALLIPGAVAVLHGVPGAGGGKAAGALTACAAGGLILGGAVAALVWLLDRGGARSVWRAVTAAAAGGAAAIATFELVCPATRVAHIVVDHAMLGLALAAVALGLSALRRRVVG